MPLPPGMIPSATSGWLNTALPSAAKRMSQLSSNSLPPPPTGPRSTAIVAFGIVRNASHIAWNGLSSVGGGGSVGNVRISADVEVGDEEVGVRRAEHDDADVVVGGELVRQLGHAGYRAGSNRLTGGLSIVTVAMPSGRR